VQEECKAKAAFEFFNDRLGMPVTCLHAINLEDLDLPQLDLSGLGNCFTKEEEWGSSGRCLQPKRNGQMDSRCGFDSTLGILSDRT
jgi:hypothetical protein